MKVYAFVELRSVGWLFCPIQTRNAKNPNNTHASDRYLPGSIVSHTPTAAPAKTSRAMIMRCCDPGTSIGLPPSHPQVRHPKSGCPANF